MAAEGAVTGVVEDDPAGTIESRRRQGHDTVAIDDLGTRRWQDGLVGRPGEPLAEAPGPAPGERPRANGDVADPGCESGPWGDPVQEGDGAGRHDATDDTVPSNDVRRAEGDDGADPAGTPARPPFEGLGRGEQPGDETTRRMTDDEERCPAHGRRGRGGSGSSEEGPTRSGHDRAEPPPAGEEPVGGPDRRDLDGRRSSFQEAGAEARVEGRRGEEAADDEDDRSDGVGILGPGWSEANGGSAHKASSYSERRMIGVMANPALLAFLLVVALLALLPTRRLHLGGWPGRAVLAYYLVLIGLALAAVELRAFGRLVVPVLVVAYLAPFVAVGDGLARLLGTRRWRPDRGTGPAPKDVTPPVALLEGVAASRSPGGSQPAAPTDRAGEGPRPPSEPDAGPLGEVPGPDKRADAARPADDAAAFTADRHP